jgi:hypothetical protein
MGESWTKTLGISSSKQHSCPRRLAIAVALIVSLVREAAMHAGLTR